MNTLTLQTLDQVTLRKGHHVRREDGVCPYSASVAFSACAAAAASAAARVADAAAGGTPAPDAWAQSLELLDRLLEEGRS